MKKLSIAAFLLAILPLTIGAISADVEDAKEDKKAMVNTLFLMDKAENYTKTPGLFAKRINEIGQNLDIPADWLMGLIHSESGFDPNVKNMKGSGAKGLIQWTKATLRAYNIKKLPKTPLEQLDYVEAYLADQKKRYGSFKNFTTLKLAVLYPVAMKKKNSYVLFESPFLDYHQNEGLDTNKDGKVTVADIEQKMKATYPEMYELN
ncbi:MAG: phage tail tip lysozyme [Chitinophagales bacterium]